MGESVATFSHLVYTPPPTLAERIASTRQEALDQQAACARFRQSATAASTDNLATARYLLRNPRDASAIFNRLPYNAGLAVGLFRPATGGALARGDARRLVRAACRAALPAQINAVYRAAQPRI
jgi:hypothetical protein